MFTPNQNLFLLAILYVFILLIISTLLHHQPTENIHVPKISIFYIFLIAFVVRLIPTIFFPFGSDYDISSFLWAGQRIIESKDIYWGLNVRHHFAFFPTYGMISAFFLHLTNLTKIPAFIFMKLFIIFFDSLISILVLIISKKWRAGLIYALSPIPIIVGAYWGQFDALPLFFSLLGLFLFLINKSLLSMFSIGIGFIFKPWPLMFAPFLLFQSKTKKSFFLMLLSLFTPLCLIIFIYKIIIPTGNLFIMFGAIALYESVIGWWGPAIIFQEIANFVHHQKIVTIPAMFSKIGAISIIFYLSNILKSKNIFEAAKLIILVIYICSFGFAIQYLLWILPFALITNDRFLKYYLIFAGSYFMIFGTLSLLTYNFTPPGVPDFLYIVLSFLLWIFFLVWGYKEMKLISRRP